MRSHQSLAPCSSSMGHCPSWMTGPTTLLLSSACWPDVAVLYTGNPELYFFSPPPI